jgi:diguanylate cyclase
MQMPQPYDSFEDASQALVELLHARYGFDLWMVTRKSAGDWIVLSANDHGYSLEAGTVFRWTDTLCARMVQGFGPMIAPRTDDVPAYRDAPITTIVPIKAYIGLPLVLANGELFGTLCAIDRHVQSSSLHIERPVLEGFARMLSGLLVKGLRSEDAERRAERAEAQVSTTTDPLTGLVDRRGWDWLVQQEETRCRRYGHPASIVYLDLDGLKVTNDVHGHEAGDAVLRSTAEALRRAARASDVIARIGGDEFAMLLPQTNDPARAVERLHVFLRDHGLTAYVGAATRHPSGGLAAAFTEAASLMYEQKRAQPIGEGASLEGMV